MSGHPQVGRAGYWGSLGGLKVPESGREAPKDQLTPCKPWLHSPGYFHDGDGTKAPMTDLVRLVSEIPQCLSSDEEAGALKQQGHRHPRQPGTQVILALVIFLPTVSSVKSLCFL